MDKTEHSHMKRIVFSALAVIVLVFGLCAVTYAFTNLTVESKDNYFQTGNIKINLNDGNSVINADKFEPGMTVNREFFIENQGSMDVYYKIYFQDIEGELAEVLNITIKNDDNVLFEGKAEELIETDVNAFDDVLAVGEKRVLTISFYYPKSEDNESEEQTLSFKIAAKAVQTKNNNEKLFE